MTCKNNNCQSPALFNKLNWCIEKTHINPLNTFFLNLAWRMTTYILAKNRSSTKKKCGGKNIYTCFNSPPPLLFSSPSKIERIAVIQPIGGLVHLRKYFFDILASRKINIFPQKWHFEDDVPFPQVGYVNSLEGIHPMATKLMLTCFFPGRLVACHPW